MYNLDKYLCNIDVGLGGCFLEVDALPHLPGESLSLSLRDDSGVLQVNLVPHQDHGWENGATTLCNARVAICVYISRSVYSFVLRKVLFRYQNLPCQCFPDYLVLLAAGVALHLDVSHLFTSLVPVLHIFYTVPASQKKVKYFIGIKD